MIWGLKVGTGELSKGSQVSLPSRQVAPVHFMQALHLCGEGGQQDGQCDSVIVMS